MSRPHVLPITVGLLILGVIIPSPMAWAQNGGTTPPPATVPPPAEIPPGAEIPPPATIPPHQDPSTASSSPATTTASEPKLSEGFMILLGMMVGKTKMTVSDKTTNLPDKGTNDYNPSFYLSLTGGGATGLRWQADFMVADKDNLTWLGLYPLGFRVEVAFPFADNVGLGIYLGVSGGGDIFLGRETNSFRLFYLGGIAQGGVHFYYHILTVFAAFEYGFHFGLGRESNGTFSSFNDLNLKTSNNHLGFRFGVGVKF